jgi:hypothetical protein
VSDRDGSLGDTAGWQDTDLKGKRVTSAGRPHFNETYGDILADRIHCRETSGGDILAHSIHIERKDGDS